MRINQRNAIVDIQTIDLSSEENLLNAKRFFEEVKDPYTFKVDDIVVHVAFGDRTSKSLQSHIQKLLLGDGVNCT